MVAVAVIDCYRSQGRDVLVIETDASNPDVSEVYTAQMRDRVEVERIELAKPGGWAKLLDCVAMHVGAVVINTAAKSEGVIQRGVDEGALRQLGRAGRCYTWWTIVDDDRTYSQLAQYVDAVAGQVRTGIVIVLNEKGPGRNRYPHMDRAMVEDVVSACTSGHISRGYIAALATHANPKVRAAAERIGAGVVGEVYMPALHKDAAWLVRNADCDLDAAAVALRDDGDADALTALGAWREIVDSQLRRVTERFDIHEPVRGCPERMRPLERLAARYDWSQHDQHRLVYALGLLRDGLVGSCLEVLDAMDGLHGLVVIEFLVQPRQRGRVFYGLADDDEIERIVKRVQVRLAKLRDRYAQGGPYSWLDLPERLPKSDLVETLHELRAEYVVPTAGQVARYMPGLVDALAARMRTAWEKVGSWTYSDDYHEWLKPSTIGSRAFVPPPRGPPAR